MRAVVTKKDVAKVVAPSRAPETSPAAFTVSPLHSSSATVAPQLRLIAENENAEAIRVYRHPDSSESLSTSSLLVSTPQDAAEREAGATASKVTRMAVPDGSVAYVNTGSGQVFRLLKNSETPEPFQIKERPQTIATAALTIPLVKRKPVDYRIQLQPERRPAATAGAAARIQSSMAAGAPLPLGVRHFMEPRFGADFSNVRIHTDDKAAALNRQLSARAFTVSNHVFFSQGSFQPASDQGRELIAHELTHTIQQGAAVQRDAIEPSDAVKVSHRSSPMVERAEIATVHGRTAGPQVQQQNIFSRGASWLGERASAVLEWAEDHAWGLIERVAPSLVPIIRRGPEGILEWLKEALSNALGTVVKALTAPVRGITGVVASVSGHLSRLVSWMQDAYARISRRDCGPVAQAAEKIEQVFSEIASPVLDRIKTLTGGVRQVFTSINDRFIAPAGDFLRSAGGAAWQRIQEFASSVWEMALPVRRLAARAWTWVKNRLGIGEGAEGQNGLLQWIESKASLAWDWVKARIEPIKRPLMIAGGVLLMLSPAGPFIALGAGVAGLIMGIRYLRQMRTPGFIVHMRQVLHGQIIPGIQSAIGTVTGALSRAAAFVTGKLDELTGGMASLVGAVGSSILRFAVSAVNWIAEQFRALAGWAHEKLTALVAAVRSAFTAVVTFLQPVFDVLGRIISIVANPFGIMGLLAGAAWRLMPECFKGPIINFIIRILLGVVRAIPGSPLLGLVWPFLRAGLIGFLERALSFDTNRKVQIADRFARLATGGAGSFILGYVRGLLLGLWDGISGPFVLLWDIAELVGGILRWMGRALATITDPAVDVGRRLLEGIRSAWETIKSDILPAVRNFLSGPSDPMRIINFIRDLLNSIVQAARSAGGRVFESLMEFLSLGDRELGHALGRFAGNILFEVLLTILTAGGYGAKPIIQRLVRWVTSAVGRVAEFAAEIGRHFPRIVGAIESVGAFARTNPAMQRIVGAVKGLLNRLAAFLRSMYGIGGTAERAAGTAERTAGRVERGAGTAERAAGRVERGAGTAEREVAAAERGAQRTGRETAEEIAERPAALLAARAITDANDAIDAPVFVLLRELMVLKRTFRWIRTFEARPVGIPGPVTVFMIASTTEIKRNYTGVNPFDAFGQARDAARQAAELGSDAVPFVQEIGPHAGRVTGMRSPDGLRGWRIDFDPRDPTKGFHINWWVRTTGKRSAGGWRSGANVVVGGTEDIFLQILARFPSR